jgi:hypothetical protein
VVIKQEKIMKYFILVIALFFVGCESPTKTERATSAVKMATNQWDGKTSPDVGLDPWGNPYRVKITEGSVYHTLEVRCDGKDKLPFTTDDIVSTASFKHGSISQEVGKSLRILGRNATQGLTEGVKEGLTKERDPNDPNQ